MSKKLITAVPEIPPEIIDAAINQKLAIFMGAGVSRIVGCKSWGELASDLINTCFNTRKVDSSKSRLITYKEMQTLLQIDDPKKVITICERVLALNGFEDKFYQSFEKSLAGRVELIESQDIYSEIYGIPALFVSTNADTHLHKKFDENLNLNNIIYKCKDFDSQSLGISKIYQIHGTILDRSSLIFRVPDYIKQYRDENFRTFLNTIFSDFVVLFVGYGLGEFEVIDFLISKNDLDIIKSEKSKKENFILLPFFQNEENILEFEQFYYQSLGIRVIPYAKDENGYNQLFNVLKNWNEKISYDTPVVIELNKKISDVILNFERSKVNEVFSILRPRSPQELHFLKQLASVESPITWFNILLENGYFRPEDILVEGRPSKNWFILLFMKNISKLYSQNSSIENLDLFLEVLDSLLAYKNHFGQRIENEFVDYNILDIIFSLPSQFISNECIEFIRICLTSNYDTTLISSEVCETIMPKLLKEGSKEQVLKLLDIVFDYEKNDKSTWDKFRSLMNNNSSPDDSYWLAKLLEANFDKINELYGIEALGIALDKVSKIIDDNSSEFEYTILPVLGESWNSQFFESYSYTLVYFITKIFESSKPNDIRNIIADLLIKEHPIFRKIAIHTISFHYNELKSLFWSIESNPLDISEIEADLYSLFELNCISFTPDEIISIINWIETMDFSYFYKNFEDIKKIEMAIAYNKKGWYYSLIKTDNIHVTKKYREYNEICPSELTHPGLTPRITTVIEDENLTDVNFEIFKESNENIASYLKNIVTEEYKKPSKSALSLAFESSVSKDLEKFTKNLSVFLNVDRIYQNSMFKGLIEASKRNESFDWNEVLNFISIILQEEEFWVEEDWEYYSNNFVYNISSLIFKGLESKECPLDDLLLLSIEKIILTLSSKTVSDSINNSVQGILYSKKYIIYSSMVSYSLRCSNCVTYDNANLGWEIIKKDFTKRLDNSSAPSIEFSFAVGDRLESLLFLDKNWVLNNIDLMFPQEEKYWEAAMKGFLYNKISVSQALYKVLRDSGNYSKAIQHSFDEREVVENLVFHVCSRYLAKEESLENNNSLISQLLNYKNVKQLLILIHFISKSKDSVEDYKNLVHNLWGKLYEILSKEERNPEYHIVIRRLVKWLEMFDELDESLVEWLKLSARIQNISLIQFPKDLLKYASKSPLWVGDILLESLTSGNIIYSREQDVRDLVNTLFENGAIESANKICFHSVREGFDFLQDLYERYNPYI